MSPQFVDFNGDGHTDIVAGIFDGSPHVAFGSKKGFAAPEQILDKNGERIVMNQFWNFDKKEWDSTTRCNPKGVELDDGHLTSAWAFDWDGDGDLDLLLGDHSKGHVMVRHNEGTAAKPAFGARNELVLAGKAPMVVDGTVATLRMFDWNRDGRQDLVVGAMGESFGDGTGAAVSVWLNQGTKTKPAFDKPTVLVASSKGTFDKASRPQSGLHMDVVDHDGDGDLDLVVGGYSHWTPPAPELTDEQTARVKELEVELKAVNQQITELLARIDKAVAGLEPDEAKAKRSELFQAEYPGLQEQRQAKNEELRALVPGDVRRSYVWLYENVGPKPKAVDASGSR